MRSNAFKTRLERNFHAPGLKMRTANGERRTTVRHGSPLVNWLLFKIIFIFLLKKDNSYYLNLIYCAARWYETGYFVRLCPMKYYRESLYVTLSHGTQNYSKTLKITKWDKVGRALKII